MEWMGISGGDGVVCGYWFVYFFMMRDVFVSVRTIKSS